MAFRLPPKSTLTASISHRFLRFLSSPSLNLPKLEPSNEADSLSQILLTHHNPFHSMESSLQIHGVSLSPFLLHQTLLRLQHSSKIALSFFLFSKSLPPPPSPLISTTSYNLVIDILGKVRQFDVVWQLILEMDQSDISPDSSTFMILVRRLIAAGFTRQAIRAYDDMGSFVTAGIDTDSDNHSQNDSSCFCFLLDTLCKYGYVKVAVEIFNERKSGFRVDSKMRASLHPDERFDRTIRNAEKLFDEMRQRGIEPDVTSFSIVLHVYSRAHKPELTLDKLKYMKEKGICPSVATYTSVIKCLCSCGRLEEAEKLLGEMVSNGVSPSAATYNCFFKEYRGRKDVNGALNLYRKMKEDKLCELSLHTYNILLGMFMKLDRIETAWEIWDDLKGITPGPDLDSYTLLINGLCEKQKWREACQLFVEMIEKGLLPQKLTFETLYKGLIQSNMLRTWRRLKKKLDEESITFGSEFQDYHFKPYRR
ncbi:hypothetical protein like AT1G52640 [Hibiscus trionum]|uniref:Pentatricopeptide repeat-containing protein n=1 Tax=Hibiscus trionum TaxID=183268 RepID=A0A9W7JHW1_HIBTR|nr:hypothetical protein like AT1G52640 [Hibiscus trionum]